MRTSARTRGSRSVLAKERWFAAASTAALALGIGVALTLGLITGLVALVTVAACLFPARRAVLRDPLTVLRSE